MENFSITNYYGRQAVRFNEYHFDHLKYGEYSGYGDLLKFPPEEENLICDMLPVEVLLYICQFLSPGAFIRFASTCTALSELTQDNHTWRAISSSHLPYFLIEKTEVDSPNVAYTKNEIQIYGIIKQDFEQNETEDDSNFGWGQPNRPKKKTKTKSNFSRLRRRTYDDYGDSFLDIEEFQPKVIELIKDSEDPKKELISLSNSLYKGFKQKEKLWKESAKKRKEWENRYQYERRFFRFNVYNLVFLSFGFFVFIMLLNIQVEGKLDSKVVYILIPFLLPFLFLAINNFVFYARMNESYIFGLGMIFLILLVQFLLIGLRADEYIKCSWLIVFIPLFLIFVSFFVGFSCVSCRDFEWELSTGIIIPLMLIIFILFLGLRLDETVKWNYGVVFVPLFLLDLLPIWICSGLCYGARDEILVVVMSIISIAIAIPLSIIEIFILLFLEVSRFNHISYAFIPLYLCFLIYFCWLCLFEVCG
ncbi:fam11a b protein [Anaeramoeba ignava]|uniref:Fam11a b protein n=1 Tax=Anaeramoeba ignava TaxID=1746090 RepID=A0A9Q0REK6_ANAIG|nr:fam11a b protein [Anaeramoeba ignava]